MNRKTKTTALVVAMNAALVGVASAHPGAPGHTHGDDWPFGVVVASVLAISAGVYGAFLKIRDSRKPEPARVRANRR